MRSNRENWGRDGLVRLFDWDDGPPRKRKSRGFSLMELMVVIAIISILAGIAFLSMLHYRLTIRVNASARELAGHMRIARANAIRDGVPYVFLFVSGGFFYGPDPDRNTVVVPGYGRQYSLEEGIQWGWLNSPGGGVGKTVPVPNHKGPGDSNACPVMTSVSTTGERCFTTVGGSGSYPDSVHFQRDGTIVERSDTAHYTNGVAHLIPTTDISGTGARDDRQRAVDWYGATGRIRVWRFDAANHIWH